MWKFSRFYGFLLLGAAALGGAPAAAQNIFPQAAQPPPFIAPNRLFSMQVPPGWQPRAFADRPDLIELRMVGRPGTAYLQVQRLPVADGARARQLLVRAVEQRLAKLPHFTELMRRDVDFNGIKGASELATYWYQGNAQYPRAIEEVYLVLGNEAFQLHFECFEPLSAQLAGDLNRMYASFVARPPVESPVAAPDDEDPLDKIPF